MQQKLICHDTFLHISVRLLETIKIKHFHHKGVLKALEVHHLHIYLGTNDKFIPSTSDSKEGLPLVFMILE